jgi:hypothetical protein
MIAGHCASAQRRDCAAVTSNFSMAKDPVGGAEKTGSFRAAVPGMHLRIRQSRAAVELDSRS